MIKSRANRVSAATLSLHEIAGLSQIILHSGHEVFRWHSRFRIGSTGTRSEQGSWFFASSAGRFDLADPRGTLNVAAGRIGAVCESLGVLTLDTEIPVQEINSRKLVSLRLPQAVRLVDFTDRKAAQNGKILTTEMSGAAGSYSAFQSLAASIDASGNDGIRSRLRFSGPEQEVGYFIFGDAGPRDWPDGQEQSIAEVVTDLGYQLVDDESLPRSEVSFNE